MSEHQRFFANQLGDGETDLPDADTLHSQLSDAVFAALQVVERDLDVGLHGGSVYVGRAGVALAYLRLAQALRRGTIAAPSTAADHLRATPEDALRRGVLHAEGALAALPPPGARHGRVSFLEGRPGGLAVYAALLAQAGRQQEAQAVVQELVSYDDAVAALEPQECELLYGRAGYLYALLYARHAAGDAAANLDSAGRLAAAARHIAAQIIETGQRNVNVPGTPASHGLLFCWHGKWYLGAAHGTAGILQTLLLYLETVGSSPAAAGSGAAAAASPVTPGGGVGALSSQAAGVPVAWPQEAAAAVEAAVDGLLRLTLPSGNLRSSLGSSGDRLVHWCHGATGLVPLLATAQRVLGPRPEWQAAADMAADDVWQRGLLRKGVGLCHGIAGSGYALLSHARATGDAQQLRRAQQFALFAAQHWQQLYPVPDAPASLFEGLAGAVCFWLDVLDPPHTAFPGYEL